MSKLVTRGDITFSEKDNTESLTEKFAYFGIVCGVIGGLVFAWAAMQ